MASGADGDEYAIEADILTAAEDLVKERFRHHDPSHDWHHVHRVRLMAINLSRCPSLHKEGEGSTKGASVEAQEASTASTGPSIDLLVLELGALFHDMCDAKYADAAAASGNGKNAAASAEASLAPFFKPYLTAQHIATEQVARVYKIVDSVSWSKEEMRRERVQRAEAAGGKASEEDAAGIAWEASCPEFKCVSDADRLDSIGSIGIMRVAAYSAAKNRPLFIPPNNAKNDPVPPAEQAPGYNGSAVAHFYEKLLKIRGDRLHTDMAKKEAERRQSMMTSFLAELDFEWTVADQGAQLALFD